MKDCRKDGEIFHNKNAILIFYKNYDSTTVLKRRGRGRRDFEGGELNNTDGVHFCTQLDIHGTTAGNFSRLNANFYLPFMLRNCQKHGRVSNW